MKITHVVDYREARRALYPDAGEQMGDLWKILEGLAETNPAVADALQACESFQAVKQIKEDIKKPAE